jgi:hypothetical protein
MASHRSDTDIKALEEELGTINLGFLPDQELLAAEHDENWSEDTPLPRDLEPCDEADLGEEGKCGIADCY